MSGPSGDLLADFLKVNGELRRINADEIAAFAKQTAPTRLWKEPFVQLGNSKVEAGFADHRTYIYKGKEVDQQVHLGFDLAVTAHVPVAAANDGTVVNASWLGIYGNCVIIDHGLGVQSLYGHLQSFDVKVGDKVTRGQIDRAQRFDRAGRRRPRAFHDARRRADGESGRMVGPALDTGSGRSQAQRCRRGGPVARRITLQYEVVVRVSFFIQEKIDALTKRLGQRSYGCWPILGTGHARGCRSSRAAAETAARRAHRASRRLRRPRRRD